MIAHVIKPSRKVNGKRQKARLFSARIRLPGWSKPKQIPVRTSDIQVARQRLAQLVSRFEKEEAGILPPSEFRESLERPLSEHVGDFIADRERSGRNWRYVRELHAKLVRLMNECGWKRIADVTSGSFLEWRQAQGGMNPKTLNEYLIAASNLMNWLRKHGRGVSVNPLDVVEKISTVGKAAFQWQALTDEQVSALLSTAGPRRPVYELAVYTGLRPGELRQLEWRDVFLDAEKPHFRLRGSTAKNGKDATIWLHRDAVAALKLVHDEREGDEPRVFFGRFPKPESVVRDFKRSGIAAACRPGFKVGFYSLRHTFCSRLQRAGIQPRVVMELMRHSDMKLTMKTYTDTELLPTADAVMGLPGFSSRPESHSQIHSQKSDAGGRFESQSVASAENVDRPQTLINTSAGRDWAHSVANSRESEDGARYRVRTCRTSSHSQGLTEPHSQIDSHEFREGFGVCEILAAWPELPNALKAGILAIVRSHQKDLSTNGRTAEVAAARAPQGIGSRAGATPELPVCGQVAVQAKDGSPSKGRKGVKKRGKAH